MTHREKFSLVLSLFLLITSLPVLSQPGGGGGRGGFGGGMGRGTSPDQLLGLLALEEKFQVTDEQLVELRSGLRAIYAKQQQMMEEMFNGGDFESVRETMMALRQETTQAAGEVLSEEQMTKLQEHMEAMQSRRGGRFGGGGRGGRGARRGGEGDGS